MIIHEFEQHSPEWYNIRVGKLTASHADAIHANGKGLETLCFDLAAEILTGKKKEVVQSAAMAQGNELEAYARTLFEMSHNVQVREVGFVEEDELCGCSPDGLIGDNCGLEIKCPQANTYAKYLYDRKIKPEYYAQMQMNMLITGRPQWWYVVYNPDFTPEIICRDVPADLKYQAELRAGIDNGKAKIREILAKIKENINADN